MSLSFKALTSRQHDRVFQDILKFLSKARIQLEKLNLEKIAAAAMGPPQPQPPRAQNNTGNTKLTGTLIIY